jgi:hypothetical protein
LVPVSASSVGRWAQSLERFLARHLAYSSAGGWGAFLLTTQNVQSAQQSLNCQGNRVVIPWTDFNEVAAYARIPDRVQVAAVHELLEMKIVAATVITVPGVQRLVNVTDKVNDVLQGMQCERPVIPS